MQPPAQGGSTTRAIFEVRRVSLGRPEIALKVEGAGREGRADGRKPGDGWKEKGKFKREMKTSCAEYPGLQRGMRCSRNKEHYKLPVVPIKY